MSNLQGFYLKIMKLPLRFSPFLVPLENSCLFLSCGGGIVDYLDKSCQNFQQESLVAARKVFAVSGASSF
jgi:hypothetical protein